MDPIGASDTWHWESYKNAIVNLKGEHLMSVPGGAHWGGGLFISTLDHALMGLLVLREGEWKGDQLISKKY